MGHTRFPDRDSFWSKLKTRIEALWDPELPGDPLQRLQVDCETLNLGRTA